MRALHALHGVRCAPEEGARLVFVLVLVWECAALRLLRKAQRLASLAGLCA